MMSTNKLHFGCSVETMFAGCGHFLDKEEQRRREAEKKNMKFVPRGDDKLDLY